MEPKAVKFTEVEFSEEKHNTESFKKTLKHSIADTYGVPDEFVYILDVTNGSVVVNYVILTPSTTSAPTDGGNSSEPSEPNSTDANGAGNTTHPTMKPTFRIDVEAVLAEKIAQRVAQAMESDEYATVRAIDAAVPSAVTNVVPEDSNSTRVILLICGCGLYATLVILYQSVQRKKKKTAKIHSAKKHLQIETEEIKKSQESLKKEASNPVSLLEIEVFFKVFLGMERMLREYQWRDFTMQSKLGSGSFGDVLLMESASMDGKLVAVKRIKINHITAEALHKCKSEMLLMSSIPVHSNIVHFYGASWDEAPNAALVMEYVSGGTLAKLLHPSLDGTNAGLSWSSPLLSIALGVAHGLEHLHSHGYIHRDVKPSNILLTQDLVPKIGDLGEARILDSNNQMTHIGTPLYMAPEIHNDGGEGYSEKVDVYSFGIMLNEMDTKRVPFMDDEGLVRFNALKVVSEHIRPHISDSCQVGLRDIICRCWCADPKQRPDFGDVVASLSALPFKGDTALVATKAEKVKEWKHGMVLAAPRRVTLWYPAIHTAHMALAKARRIFPNAADSSSSLVVVAKVRNFGSGVWNS